MDKKDGQKQWDNKTSIRDYKHQQRDLQATSLFVFFRGRVSLC